MDILARFAATVFVVTAMSLSGAFPVSAQVFAPGPLSSVHAPWKSVTQCDTCHSPDVGVDRKKCLSCHSPIAARMEARKGVHGQRRVREKPCEACHPEHRGRAAVLIPWPGGRQSTFDHKETGWPLRGAHRKVNCEKCHDKRHIADPAVRAYLKTNPRANTKLGLPTACPDCHYNEHRLSKFEKCEACHDETAWKPAGKFVHERVWPLKGAHGKTACVKCHVEKRDPAFDKNTFPCPRAASYLNMASIPHALCTDCHKDPHNNRFGTDCLSCHSMDSWTLDAPPRRIGFHDETDFPLKGRHRFVPCRRCHPKDTRGRTILKPIAHERCDACHPNAHPDIELKGRRRRDCTACHDNNRFKPSLFTLSEHQRTDFPLQGAHTTAACPDCHLKKMGKPYDTGDANRKKGFLASRVTSPWRLSADIAPTRCDACHDAPHRDQFAGRACTECHNDRSWTVSDREFNHDKTRYPLTGKHRDLPCSRCHPDETDEKGTFVRYRPLPFRDCAACHTDPHYGQFDQLSPKVPCATCHQTSGFAPTRFDHNDAAYSDFALRGRHATLDCARCHPKVLLDGTVSVVRYRPTMKTCDGCHEDAHSGAYRSAAALLSSVKKQPPNSAANGAWAMPKSWYPNGPENRTDCTACHAETGWHDVAFDHSSTRFPLKARHKRVPCDKCHKGGLKQPIARRCNGCHQDVHRGSLGEHCEECHTEEGFKKTEKVFARHNRTEFPLTGKHAALPCTECHRDVRSRAFNRTPKACEACHAADIPGPAETSVDHTALTTGCDRCHTPVGWSVAAYQGHDRCFPIGTVTKHGSVTCKKCHQGPPPSAIRDCNSGRFSCIQCHGCEEARHRNVRGFTCEDEHCYSCHPKP